MFWCRCLVDDALMGGSVFVLMRCLFAIVMCDGNRRQPARLAIKDDLTL